MTDTPPARRGLIPPQQRRSEQTLARILQGAMSLMATRGLAAISMEEVAAAAGVSVGTLYRRFKSREDLVAEMLRDLQLRQLAVLETELEADRWAGVGLEARLDWIVARQAEAAARAPGFIRIIFASLTTREGEADAETTRLNDRTTDLLARWLLACEDEIGAPDPEATARVAVAQLSISLNLARLYPASFSPLPPETVVPLLKRAALLALRGDPQA
ncbi:MAG: helix-turn-helix domain-containing protein [Pseudomonadota bacterium]